MRKIIINRHRLSFSESEQAYVSPYSSFFLDHLHGIVAPGLEVCDYGAGTGILGIAATVNTCLKRVCFVEKNVAVQSVLIDNTKRNLKHTPYEIHKNVADISSQFDVILCNPASLPNCVDVDPFCDGGELGIDMILEVIDFATRFLRNDGVLFLIVTKLLPMSLIISKLQQDNLSFEVIAEKTIPFRRHYDGIAEWVDRQKSKYNEMSYISYGKQFFEVLQLLKIKRFML